MLKRVLLTFILIFPLVILAHNNQVYQAGTITALTNGQYDASITLKELEKKGKFGLGTIDGAKGEMIIFDGKAYLSDITGQAVPLKDNITVPFADVFSFKKPNINTDYENLSSEKILDDIINKKLSGPNYFYIFKITGKFSNIHARTIPPAKKGILLSDWIKDNQKFHDLKNVEGTLIGIYSPKYLSTITVPGFHLHFINKNKSEVYHVYSFDTKKVNLEVEKINDFTIMLPNTKEYKDGKINDISHNTISKMEESK
ncbi:acetolactate decarboxylase [Pseudofrancisella aestuarii]|uniref:Alpha-acetolactate decarboxylase n=1 Tax=Pseudofrancisella aestuarii TaxID=2670347 RepID=A0ABV9T967_9GAMM|nr:acetolactate decarboxylase [Pseudofrancisella aestuarii]